MMPKKQPTMSYTLLRNYTEKFQWINPKTGIKEKGFNPPADAVDKERVPFFIRYLTLSGKTHCGEVTCIAVDVANGQRDIKYVTSNVIHTINDQFVLEVDGVEFLSH